jgi:hypothetical protein
MKYIIYQQRGEEKVALTFPGTKVQAENTFNRMSRLGIQDIILEKQSKEKTKKQKEVETLRKKAMKDFQRYLNEKSVNNFDG